MNTILNYVKIKKIHSLTNGILNTLGMKFNLYLMKSKRLKILTLRKLLASF